MILIMKFWNYHLFIILFTEVQVVWLHLRKVNVRNFALGNHRIGKLDQFFHLEQVDEVDKNLFEKLES